MHGELNFWIMSAREALNLNESVMDVILIPQQIMKAHKATNGPQSFEPKHLLPAALEYFHMSTK